MLTLTQASITARKSIRYGIYFIIFIIIGRITLMGVVGIYKKLFPPKDPPPTVAFGKLPSLSFPEKEKINLSFTLETPEGVLPQTPNQIMVYFMPKLSANLLSLDFAKEKANYMGFKSDPVQINESLYSFSHINIPSMLKINIVTGAFSLSYDLIADSSPLETKPPLVEIAVSNLKSFLDKSDSLPEDISSGKYTHTYLKHFSSGLVPVSSSSEANLIRVDLFRQNYNDLPCVTPTPDNANVWFLVSGITDKNKNIISGEYHYFPVDEEKFSTYPLKDAQAAWNEFSSGNYYAASNGTAIDNENIKIRRIYLAYYDAGVQTDFFQPVFVFEGTEKGFLAYVPAISAEYYGE